MTKKRHISFLFLFIFIFSNVGWSINAHYCQGELKETSLLHNSIKVIDELTETMPCCETDVDFESPQDENNKDCCKDEIVKSNTSDQNLVKVIPLQLELLSAEMTWNTPFFNNIHIAESTNNLLDSYLEANAPPLFKLYCRLLFYA